MNTLINRPTYFRLFPVCRPPCWISDFRLCLTTLSLVFLECWTPKMWV